MVKKEIFLYLLIGQDSYSKDIKLKKIKEEFSPPKTRDFNLDILYGKELSLTILQERLLVLPIKANKRIIIIKGAQSLKEDIKNFIIKFAKNPVPKIILVLDIDTYEPKKDEFINSLGRYAEVYRSKDYTPPNTFTLSRSIDSKNTKFSLCVLNQLLKNGERPERILGGLRYAWINSASNLSLIRKKLKFLLNCDLDIKRGRFNPEFALEKLVISLCAESAKLNT